jgi:hypothetical protein
MQFRETLAYFEDRMKYVHKFCGQNDEFNHVEASGTQNNDSALKGSESPTSNDRQAS